MTKRSSTSTARSPRATATVDVTPERQNGTNDTAVPNDCAYTLGRCGRHWEVRDPTGALVCLTVYKRGAAEVIRRLSA
jgi:hypothetical protein